MPIRSLALAMRVVICVVGLIRPLSAQVVQQSSALTAAGERTKLVVYLEEFKQQSTGPIDVDVADLARTLLRLQLRGMRYVDVRDAGGRRIVCGLRSVAQTRAKSTPVSEGDSTFVATLPTMTVSFGAVADSARILVDVSLKRCAGGELSTVKHDDTEIGWRAPLPELLALLGSISRRVQSEIPRTRVAVAPFESGLSDTGSKRFELAADAVDRIVERLGRLDDMRVVDAATDTADYRITGRMSFSRWGDGIEAVLFVTQRGSTNAADSAVVAGSDQNRDAFYTAVADSAAGRLKSIRANAALGAAPSVGGVADTTLEARARRALCLGMPQGCVASPDAAVTALHTLLATRHDAELFILLGRAERARRNTVSAVDAYREALTAGASAQDRTDALRNLADIYREKGDNREAVAIYDQLLQLHPTDSLLALDRAVNLRLAHYQISALRALAELAVRNPGWDVPRVDFENTLADTRAEDLADSVTAVATICNAAANLRPICVRVIGDKTEQLSHSAPRTPHVRALAGALIQLASTQPSKQSEAYAYLGASSLGTSYLRESNRGRPELIVRDTMNLAAAGAALSKADSLARIVGDAPTREWVARLRAEFFLERGEFTRAYGEARRALAIRPGTEGRLMAVQMALTRGIDFADRQLDDSARAAYRDADTLMAPLVNARVRRSYFYLGEVKHVLGQDVMARSQLEAIVRQTPTDDDASRALNMVCIEYLKDYECALRAQRVAYQTGLLHTFEDSLSAVETAVVFGDLATSRQWLAPLLPRPAAACEKAVAYLYASWIAAAAADDSGRVRANAGFRDALGERDCRGHWLFEGAKAKLRGSSPPPMPDNARTDLLQMIDAIERKSPMA
jgi:tetratricopeptide (TPR) repeat protein